MKCPYCGSEEGYYEIEKVHRTLLYTFDGEPDGCSEDYNDWTSKRKYCRYCNRILPQKMFDDNQTYIQDETEDSYGQDR